MVNFCSVVGCSKRSNRDKDVSFYRIPAEISHQGEKTQELSKKRRDLWISRIGRADFQPNPHSRVCSRHFIGGKPSPLYDEINPDWAPSICLGGAPEPSRCSVSRYERAVQRGEKKRRLDDAVLSLPQLSEEVMTVLHRVEAELDSKEQHEKLKKDHEKLKKEHDELRAKMDEFVSKVEYDKLKEVHKGLKKDHDELREKCAKLLVDNSQREREKEEMEKQLKLATYDEDCFRGNNDKVRFFTGLTNWDILSKLFQYVKPYLGDHLSLTPFQQLMLTLMRLRLPISGVQLGYHFGVHPSTVSRIFASVIEMLYVRLKFLIVWPEREVLRKTLPMDFRKNCPKCVVIIDCFEIFIDRPSDLLARAQTYSSYKHHNTVKYLIGITPQGSVSFISDGWGGRASDKHITENSSLLNNLHPGDTILADRGLDIQASVGLYCATVSIPAFTRGKKQLEGIDVEQTRTIANVRIHVERVIGNVRKKYTMLSTTQPIDYIISKDKAQNSPTLLDMIVTVCCALNNICNSVVPFD